MEIKNKYDISIISFKIMDSSGKQIYMLPIKGSKYEVVSCECIVYLPDNFKNYFSNDERVYFHLFTYEKTSFDRPLLYQESDILVKDLPENGLLRLTFKMNFPSALVEVRSDDKHIQLQFQPYKLVGYRFSVSANDLTHPADDENESTFFDTVIPSEVIDNAKSN